MNPLLLAVLTFAASAAGAAQISFEEIPAANRNCCYLGEEYAALGIHFLTSDDGSIWDGLSNGDPGGWGVEGTNGASFLAFNGSSYALTALFDGVAAGVSLDVAASAGSAPGSEFTLEGRMGGSLVQTVTVTLGSVNEWQTVALTQEVDEVRWFGSGSGFHPFAVDDLQWSDAVSTASVEIDIMPGNQLNPIHPLSQGLVKVVVFGSAEFDPASMDATTLVLGTAPIADSHAVRFQDVDGDGFLDCVSHHRVPEMGLAFGDTELCISGQTLDGASVEGCDAVLTVPSSTTAQAERGKQR